MQQQIAAVTLSVADHEPSKCFHGGASAGRRGSRRRASRS